MTADRVARSDGRTEVDVRQIALQSTGVLWRPIVNRREDEARPILLYPRDPPAYAGRAR
jgi:hypothetical protein